MHIQILLFDGFDLLDAIAPFEVLHAARTATGGALAVELVSAEGARDVPCGGLGQCLRTAGPVDLDRAQVLLIPGASGPVEGDGPDTIPAILGRVAGSAVAARVAEALSRPDRIVATVCGGSLVLGLAGLLEGRHAVTHHEGMDVLATTGAIVVRARVVDDGNLITAAGVTSGLDLGLYLVERLLGPRVAHHVETQFAHERRGVVWAATGAVPIAAGGR